MSPRRPDAARPRGRPRAAVWVGAGLGCAIAGYAALVAAAWVRYGAPRPAAPDEADGWLERFMPVHDVAERHQIRVEAPADVALAAALDVDLERSAIVRAIIRTRERVLGARGSTSSPSQGIGAQMTTLGWGLLAREPGREVVFGAVTQPWQAHVVFRAVPPDDFEAFQESGLVKIAWTLRADPVGPRACVLKTETRAVATDPEARRRFRWYWARFSPGILVIRHVVLRMARADAERRFKLSG